MPLPRLLRLGRPVDPPPAAHDALYVGGRARAAHGEQPGLGLRRRHAGEGAHLGVRELPATQGLGEAWQRPEGAGYPYAFPRGAQIQPHSPGEPSGAGAETRVPTTAGIKLADQVEEPRGGGVEMGGELGDLLAEAVQLLVVLRGRVSVHGEPSSYGSDSTPRVLGLRKRRQRNDLAAGRDFSIQCTRMRAPRGSWFLSSDTSRWLPPHPQVTRRNLSSAIVVHMCMAPHTLTLVTYTESIGSLP